MYCLFLIAVRNKGALSFVCTNHINAGPRSTIGSKSDCCSRGCVFFPGMAQYFHIDSPPSTDQEGLLLQAKVCGVSIVKLVQEKSLVRLTDLLGMTIAVDLDVKPQTKQNHIWQSSVFTSFC